MGTKTIAAILLVSAVAGSLIACAAQPRTKGLEWPLSAAERLAAEGIQGQIMLLNDAIARVASGDESKQKQIVEVALALRNIDGRAQELQREAATQRSLTIALVRSGSVWVEAPK